MTTVAALAALLSARAALGQAGPAPAASSPARPIPSPAAVLLSRNATQVQRDEAARRLLANSNTDPRALFTAVLRDGGHDAQLAVARAIADTGQGDSAYIDLLANLLGNERNLNEAAARALGRLGNLPAARDRLLAFARNGAQPPGLRAAAIRACAQIVDKSVAGALVDLLGDDRQGAAINTAAAEALLELTGQTNLGRDPAAWRKWFNANANRSDNDWKLLVYSSRDPRLQEQALRHSRLVTELDSLLSDQFQSAVDKNAVALRDLSAGEPEVRASGARIVRDAFLGGVATPSDAQKARLTEMVGDSDPTVRLEAARTLKAINYAGALDAMLSQLSFERDPDVRTALAGAIGQIGDVRAASGLERLLHDPSTTVARAAAEALRQLTPAIYQTDRTGASRLAQDLWQTAQQRATEPGGAELEAACIEALAPLREVALVLPLTRLLDPEQQERVRSAALRALGDLGDPNTDDAIRTWLAQETDPNVRLDALDALGKTGSFGADADALYAIFGPRSNEPVQTVRDRAWQVFQSLLPTAPKQLLNTWASVRLPREPEHRLAVLIELNRKLLADRDLDSLAVSQENTGDTYLKLGQSEQAAIYFRKALDYYQGQHVENAVTEHLVSELMGALLSSRQYPEAAKFAQSMIASSRSQQQTMGSMFVQAADALREAASKNPGGPDKADALRLISEALKMNPALDGSYQDELKGIQRDLQQGQAGQ